MRDSGTTSAGELGAAVMAARNIPETDNQVRRDFVACFLNTLHDLLRRGTVEEIGSGRGVRRKLAEREPGLGGTEYSGNVPSNTPAHSSNGNLENAVIIGLRLSDCENVAETITEWVFRQVLAELMSIRRPIRYF